MSDSESLREQQEQALARLRSRSWRTLLAGLVPLALLIGFLIFAVMQIRASEAPLQAIAESLGVDVADAPEEAAEAAERVVAEVTEMADEQGAIVTELDTAEVPGERPSAQVSLLVSETQAVRQSLGGAVAFDEVAEEVQAMVDQRVVLEGQVAESGRTIAALEAGQAAATQTIATLEADLDEANRTIESLQGEQAEAGARQEALNAELTTLAARAEAAEGQVGAMQEAVASLETRVETLAAGETRLETALASEQERNAALLDSLREAGEADAQVKALLEAQGALERELAELRDAQAASGKSLAEARQQRDAAERRAGGLEQEKQDLAAALASAQAEIGRLEAEASGSAAEATAELAALRDENESLVAAVAAAKLERTAATEARDRANAEAEKLSAEIEPLTSALEAARAEVARLTDSADGAGREAESLRGRVADLEDRIADLLGGAEGNGEALAALRRDLASVTAALEAARTAAASAEAGQRLAESEREELRRAVADLEGTVARLNARPRPPVGPRDDGSLTVYFGFDNADVTPAVRWSLELIARMAQERELRRVSVIGFADSAGNARYNEELSRRRAAAVAAALQVELEQLGLAGLEVQQDARGESALPVQTADGIKNEENRRVEVRLE